MDRKEALSNQHSAVSQNQDRDRKQQQMQEQELFTPKQRAEALLRRIGEACDELDRLAEENPELIGRVIRGAEEHKDAYLRLKARLQLADAAPRCRWVKQDGTACRSPQMKKHIYCFAHAQMMEARALALSLPAPEDANAIQIGIMKIQKALIEDTISTKKAGLLLYSMQLALQNVGQVTFGQAKTEELVRETMSEEEALSTQQSALSKNREPFTTEDAEEKQDLPLMNADDFDSGKVDEQFVPMPGGYGYTRVRLRAEPDRKPVQAAITADDPAQPGAAVPHGNSEAHGVAQKHAKQG